MSVYTFMTDVVVDALMNNIGTLMTHNTTLDVLTQTSQLLSFNWTSGPGSSSLQQEYADLVGDPADGKTLMANFIKTFLNQKYLYGFSAFYGTEIMSLLSQSSYWDSDAGPSQMNILNQWNSMVSSTAQNDENTGQNLVKGENSIIQSDANAQQPLSDIDTAALGIFGNIGTLLQQLYS